jgi:hypothetical protein
LAPAAGAKRILDAMRPTLEAWNDEVRTAAIAGDGDALRRLFDAAKELYGEDAGAKWAEAVSALDASAQTG